MACISGSDFWWNKFVYSDNFNDVSNWNYLLHKQELVTDAKYMLGTVISEIAEYISFPCLDLECRYYVEKRSRKLKNF